MVFATAVPVTAPAKLRTAEMSTAARMGSTPVDTTVAIAFAAYAFVPSALSAHLLAMFGRFGLEPATAVAVIAVDD